mmetsp:Transcript_22071/g.24668  ORF Transcript_22071/g.24668 Transcript_22071/m.24668 type:complete len:332 (-) Transcript_22071:136-1131(-)
MSLVLFQLYIIVTAWLVSDHQLYAQPVLPQSRGCKCQCEACNGCMFEDSTACPRQNGGGDIDLGSLGVDCVVVDASAGTIVGTDGADCIMITGSSTIISGEVTGERGNDCIIVQDKATVMNLRGNQDDDCIRVIDSTTSRVIGSNGVDDIIFEGVRTDSTGSFADIEGRAGDDCIRVLPYNGVPSILRDIQGDTENDCIEVQNSVMERIRAGDGDDIIDARCSSIFSAEGRGGDDVIILSSITVPVSASEVRIVRGGNDRDLIIIEDEIQNSRVDGRIDGGNDEDVCCLADQMGTEIRDCEIPTTCVSPCPMMRTPSMCNRRLSTCIALTT